MTPSGFPPMPCATVSAMVSPALMAPAGIVGDGSIRAVGPATAVGP